MIFLILTISLLIFFFVTKLGLVNGYVIMSKSFCDVMMGGNTILLKTSFLFFCFDIAVFHFSLSESLGYFF